MLFVDNKLRGNKMSSNKMSELSSDLIVRKGEASPSVIHHQGLENKKNIILPNKKTATIAVTLRLNEKRYKKLKLFGVHNNITNQDILISALDAYLS